MSDYFLLAFSNNKKLLVVTPVRTQLYVFDQVQSRDTVSKFQHQTRHALKKPALKEKK